MRKRIVERLRQKVGVSYAKGQFTQAEIAFLDLNCHGWRHRLSAGEDVLLIVIKAQPHHNQDYDQIMQMVDQLRDRIPWHIVTLSEADTKL